MITRWFRLFFLVLVTAAFLSGCASGQLARNFTDRSGVIAARIDQAEILGARRYAPKELARARASLERALHEASESYNPIAWVHAEFDKAEIAANELLLRRSLAATP